MAKRGITAVLLAAALLTPVTSAVPALAASFTVSVAGDGPFAPGIAVTVSLAGGSPNGGAVVEQCAETGDVCGYSEFVELDSTGAGEIGLKLRRHLATRQATVDCATSACIVQARGLPTDVTASAPIRIDGSVPIARPLLAVNGATPLPDRAVVDVTGGRFEAFSQIELFECAWTDSIRCLDGALGFAMTDSSGNLSVQMPVLRTVAGIDCAGRPGLCQIWAAPSGNADHVAAAPLDFDPTSPSKVPAATASPDSGLTHGQLVRVAGSEFLPSSFVQLSQCVLGDESALWCRFVNETTTDASGSFAIDVAVSRRVSVEDCATAPCVLRVAAFPTDTVDVALSFDASVPPPPIPSVEVEPSSGLVDWQVVDVSVRDVDPDSYISIELCTVDRQACRGFVSQNIEGPTATIPMAMPRLLAPDVDCAVVPCAVQVQLYSGDSYEYAIPVAFDADAPLGPSAGVRVLPATGLWDRQRVEVRGERFEPGAAVQARQCLGVEVTNPNCGTPTELTVNGRGEIGGRFTVRRLLALPSGEHDCVVVECSLVIDAGEPIAIALAFDPGGPFRGSDLPPQRECVSWPTEQWPVGALPDGVDTAAVHALGKQMVGSGGGDSVVVIHGGRLVYENYAEGVTADSILPSFSVSKSFTSTVVGLLVDDGALALDARAPIPEWSAPDDPRRAITLRNILNMSSGLEWWESYVDGGSDVIQMILAENASAYVVAKPLDFEPGTQFRYSTGDTQVLGRIIGDTAGVSGDSYQAFLDERLFDPLGINPVAPAFDGAGTWLAGAVTDTTTRNFAKLGLLYLRNGVWEGEQFLSSEWVDFVRAPSPASNGYGGQFWLDGDGGFRMVGLYGQTVHIVPELDLIVAVNNGGSTYSMVELFRNAQSASCDGDVAPVAIDDRAEVAALGSVDVDVLANDSGGAIGFAPATLTISDPPAHGAAEVVDGIVRYHSDSGSTGTDTMSYLVCTNDRRTCVEANAMIEVQPLAFEFRPPLREGLNVRAPGHRVFVPFRMDVGESAISEVASVPVECATDEAIGPRDPVDTQLHARPRSGRGWFWWPTLRAWSGCRDLEVTLADGQVHVAHFLWRRSDSQSSVRTPMTVTDSSRRGP